MCTSIIFSPKDHYFGRNLDLELSFGQQVVITPRNYDFKFRKMPEIKSHYAMVGVSLVAENYPLYFDAANEKGLGMAGLNYPGNADYKDFNPEKTTFLHLSLFHGFCVNVQRLPKLKICLLISI